MLRNSDNDKNEDPALPEDMAQMLRRQVWETQPDNCPSPEAINDYADLSLPLYRRRLLRRHIRRCPSCAVLAAEMIRAMEPVRLLHTGNGAYLAAREELPEGPWLKDVWNQHAARCRSCRMKEGFHRLFAPRNRLSTSRNLALLCAYSILLVVLTIQTPYGGRVRPGDTSRPPFQMPKGVGPGQSGVPPDQKTNLVEVLKLPKKGEVVSIKRLRQIKADVEMWKEVRDQPGVGDIIPVHAQLQRIYQWLSEYTKDAAEAAVWRSLDNEERKAVNRLNNKLNVSPPVTKKG
jgi:hypothetical protein